MDTKSPFYYLPSAIIAKILLLLPTSSIINLYSVNSTHLKLFDDQNGLWEVITRNITKCGVGGSVSEDFPPDQTYNTDNWKKEFRIVSYFNSLIRENELVPKNQPQNPQTLAKNHFKTEAAQQGAKNHDYICLQSELQLYPLPEGNFKTAYFEVKVLNSSNTDTPFFIGGALEGYNGPVGHGRSSYGYASDGSIYIECEISPEDDPATAELEHYSAHYYEADEHLNPVRTDRKIHDGDVVGFGINFAKNAVFFTKNGNLVYEAKETFAVHPRQFMIEPLCNVANLHATLSLNNNMEVKFNMGSTPFEFDLIKYQHKKDLQPAWLRSRQAAPEPMRPYSEIILDHLTAVPDANLQEFEFRYETKAFIADYNPPADPSCVSPVVYALTYGKVPKGIDNISQELISTYESWRKIITAKNVPILPDKPATDIRKIVEQLSNEFEMDFHPYAPWKDKITPLLDVVMDKLGPVAFDIIASCVTQISEMTFYGNKACKKWGTQLLAVHEYFRVDRPEKCQWMKHTAAGIITNGQNEWKTHNTPEHIYLASISTVSACRVQLGMKARALQQHEKMIEMKQTELEKLKHVFYGTEDLTKRYEELIAALKNHVASTKKCDLFPVFKRQKEIEQALNGKSGSLKKYDAAFYGVYGLKISPNEFATIDEYLHEVAIQNRKLLTDPLNKSYLEHLLGLTRDLPLDEKFRGNLEYKVNRPMNAVFGIEMELAFEQENSPEDSKRAAIQYVQQEIDKLADVESKS